MGKNEKRIAYRTLLGKYPGNKTTWKVEKEEDKI
jgi:hypothetical protein